MPRKINEIGNIYGRLQVIREATKEERGNLTGGCYWICKCDCGNEKMINGHSLRDGSTTSCGCYNKEVVSETSKKKVIDEDVIEKKEQLNICQICHRITILTKLETNMVDCWLLASLINILIVT